MGLFDKLKSATNFITGAGAKVSITSLNAEYDKDAPIRFCISAEVKDKAVNIKKVYLDVQSRENIFLKKTINGQSVNINEKHIRFQRKIEVAGPQTLEANQSYEWDVEFSLPPDAQPSFQGVMANNIWEAMAALDASGNDPDSGWIEIKVR